MTLLTTGAIHEAEGFALWGLTTSDHGAADQHLDRVARHGCGHEALRPAERGVWMRLYCERCAP